MLVRARELEGYGGRGREKREEQSTRALSFQSFFGGGDRKDKEGAEDDREGAENDSPWRDPVWIATGRGVPALGRISRLQSHC